MRGVFGGVAGVGAALGETPVGGELPVKVLTAGPQAIIVQLSTTGASRWSSPGHPRRNDSGESHHMLIASSPQQHQPRGGPACFKLGA